MAKVECGGQCNAFIDGRCSNTLVSRYIRLMGSPVSLFALMKMAVPVIAGVPEAVRMGKPHAQRTIMLHFGVDWNNLSIQ